MNGIFDTAVNAFRVESIRKRLLYTFMILGIFMLGLFSRRANKQGLYIGIAAAVLFTAYAVLTSTKGEQLVLPRVYEAIQRLLIPLCTVVLAPSDLPGGPRRHGLANQLGSALAYYLSLDEKVSDALLHAQTYLKQLPAVYADGNTRSEELYNQFLDAVEHYYNRYADVAFYAEQLNVSARYLAQVTRQIAGIVGEIAAMLSVAHPPLKEVAQRLGFSSQAHLSRFFKKRKGVSPTEFQHKQ